MSFTRSISCSSAFKRAPFASETVACLPGIFDSVTRMAWHLLSFFWLTSTKRWVNILFGPLPLTRYSEHSDWSSLEVLLVSVLALRLWRNVFGDLLLLDDRVGVALLLLCRDTLVTFSGVFGEPLLGLSRDRLLNSVEQVLLRVWLRVLGAMLSMVCGSRYSVQFHVKRNSDMD